MSFAKSLTLLARDTRVFCDGLADVDRVRIVVLDLTVNVTSTWQRPRESYGRAVGRREVLG